MRFKLLFILFLLFLLSSPSAFAAGAKSSNQTIIKLPKHGLELKVDLPGFTIEKDSIFSNSHVDFLATNDKKQVIFDVFSKEGSDNEKTCLEEYLDNVKKEPFWTLADIAFSNRDGVISLEYSIIAYGGEQTNQQNVVRCFIKNNVWIYAH